MTLSAFSPYTRDYDSTGDWNDSLEDPHNLTRTRDTQWVDQQDRVDERAQAEMVAFAVRWAPFGGGPSDDIFVTFGVSERVFFQRLHRILADDPRPGLDEVMWRRLRQVCTQRLTNIDPARRPPNRSRLA